MPKPPKKFFKKDGPPKFAKAAKPYVRKPKPGAPEGAADSAPKPASAPTPSSGFVPPTKRKFPLKDRGARPERPDRPYRPGKAERDATKPVVAKADVPEVPEVVEELPPFTELGLSEQILKAVTDLGFEAPTPIQARSIPILLQGRDLLGLAQTGTGKTAAFALPLLQKLDLSRNDTQALVLAPTRELAVQVADGIHKFAKHLGAKVIPVYGGQPIDRQLRALRNGAHVVVGTPGRIQDHLRRGSLHLNTITICVLDEADEMLALGFQEDIESILAELPDERQLAFFSATMPARINLLTQKFLRDPVRVAIESKRRTVDNTNQAYYEVPRGKKLDALVRVLDMETPGPTIVFCRTRQDTQDLADALSFRGYGAEPIHGDMGQTERDRVMKRFRDGQVDLLIATDVAARGLDIETVTHVINYDIPWDVEQYIHRIGRTGRAGRTGDAITLVEGRERRQLQNIERMIGATIKPARIPTVADIAARRREVFKESIRETLRSADISNQLATVGELAEEFELANLAAAALHMLWMNTHGETPDNVEEHPVEYEQRPELGMAKIFVGLGRQDNLRPGDLVGAISNETGMPGKMVGAIEILDHAAFVEVPMANAEQVIEALRNTKIRNRKVKVELARPPGMMD